MLLLARNKILLVEGHAELEDVALFAMGGQSLVPTGGGKSPSLRAASPPRT